ncbi:unnamed protein product [Phytomonas sp. EM1]|nr:unnamed protein product [Phytomonas sp. EM1]|eukprot:CCW61840.1 unnamed protein product [Phytomonas sp. isolate EM1]
MVALLLAILLILLTASMMSISFLRRGVHKAALDPINFQPFRLMARRQVSPDSFVFRFALPHPSQELGLPIGQHIALRAECDLGEGKKELVVHSYTPIAHDTRGYVDLLIKVYFAGVHPKYPRGGRLTQHLYRMQMNDTIDVRGPKGRLEYLGGGNCSIPTPPSTTRRFHVDRFAMIAGGSGITPFLQIIHAIRKDPSDRTEVDLIYANQSPEDILLREELDTFVREGEGRVRVWYTVDRDAPSDWAYDVGYITEEMLRAHLPIPSKPLDGDAREKENTAEANGEEKRENEKERSRSVLALVCGPPAMNQVAVKPNLLKIGYAEEDIFIF